MQLRLTSGRREPAAGPSIIQQRHDGNEACCVSGNEAPVPGYVQSGWILIPVPICRVYVDRAICTIQVTLLPRAPQWWLVPALLRAHSPNRVWRTNTLQSHVLCFEQNSFVCHRTEWSWGTFFLLDWILQPICRYTVKALNLVSVKCVKCLNLVST